MKKLYPTFCDTKNWGGDVDREYKLSQSDLKKVHADVLKRDNNACQYCGFSAKKYQSVNPLDGDMQNNKPSNLVTVCPMCKLILNSDYGCVQESIVKLYKESGHPQNRLVQLTREMRADGRTDDQIVRELGLRQEMPFKRDRFYLESLYAFISSWKGSLGRAEEALAYGYRK